MRRTSQVVLPVPAAASTSIVASRCRAILSRWAWSGSCVCLATAQLPIRRERHEIGALEQLLAHARGRESVSADRLVVAERAIVVVARRRKRPGGNQAAQ